MVQMRASEIPTMSVASVVQVTLSSFPVNSCEVINTNILCTDSIV